MTIKKLSNITKLTSIIAAVSLLGYLTYSNSSLLQKAEALSNENAELLETNSIIIEDNFELQTLNEEISNTNSELTAQLEEEQSKDYDVYQVAEETYNVPAVLLKAIEKLETGNYTSELYTTQNNTYGCRTSKGWCSFDSHEQSTMELARLLAFSYGVEGDNYDLVAINKVYCPDSDTWATKVQSIINELESA